MFSARWIFPAQVWQGSQQSVLDNYDGWSTVCQRTNRTGVPAAPPVDLMDPVRRVTVVHVAVAWPFRTVVR
jgi:hypothetical protein